MSERNFYTQNGWEGNNYDNNLDIKNIAKIVREYLKEKYPKYKFSITIERYSGGQSMTISLISSPVNIFTESYLKKENVNKGYAQLNKYYLNTDERLTEDAVKMFEEIKELIDSYNYDDSDAMIDYFDTNFYWHLHIGKWNKPLQIK